MFDLLVNGLGCRQTEAQWSFDYLYKHSHDQEVQGGTSATVARVVNGAVLVAAKLHSARETDLRDVLAVAEDIELESVTPHLQRGDLDVLQSQLQQGREILDSDELQHGFKSDFGASTVSTETVTTVPAVSRRPARATAMIMGCRVRSGLLESPNSRMAQG
ncbi:MAG: hypothetical protein U5K37_11645 [Natrialbaceae archaeon]|nr:hypothetical protein [Natrialbaceae archaeon]